MHKTNKKQNEKFYPTTWGGKIRVQTLLPWNVLTSTLEARKTQVGAMSTGSILLREYLEKQQQQVKHVSDKQQRDGEHIEQRLSLDYSWNVKYNREHKSSAKLSTVKSHCPITAFSNEPKNLSLMSSKLTFFPKIRS